MMALCLIRSPRHPSQVDDWTGDSPRRSSVQQAFVARRSAYSPQQKRRHLAVKPVVGGLWLPSQQGNRRDRRQRQSSRSCSRSGSTLSPSGHAAAQSGSADEPPQRHSNKLSPGLTWRTSGRMGADSSSSRPRRPAQSTQTRALRNMRSQPASSCHSSGFQEFCTARNTRSGCGIMMVTRPSRLVRPVIPRGEPLGLAG